MFKENISHHNYTDGIVNTKKMILMTEFILENDFEDEFVNFLNELDITSFEWSDFSTEIKELITEFEIDDDEIKTNTKTLIKVKPLLVC